MSRGRTNPGFVVGRTVTALGTSRSLTRVGIDAFTVTGPREIVRHSRWYKPIPGHDELLPDTLADWLPDLAIERAVLFPCSEHAVWQASQLAEAVKDRVSMSVAPTTALETLIDKGQFASMLERIEIPHPRTWQLEDGRIPDSLSDGVFASAFLKPVDSQSFIRRFGIKAQRVESKQHAVRELE